MSAPAPSTSTRSVHVDHIVGAARAVLEAEGPEALTMRRVAGELGVQAPSLYKHLPGKGAMEAALVEQALFEMGTALHHALAHPGRRSPVAALLAAYRRVAVAHPHLYRLATTGRLPRDLLPEGLEAWSGEPFGRAAGDEHRARALWSFAHGMVILELDGRYPDGADLDAAWRAGVEAFS